MTPTPMDCWRIGWLLWLGGLSAQAALMARAWGALGPGAAAQAQTAPGPHGDRGGAGDRRRRRTGHKPARA